MSKFIPNSFQLPNVIVDEYINKLSSHAFKLLVFIVRKTKGWNKEMDLISATQFAKVLGVKTTRKVYPYIKELESKKLIKIHKEKGKINGYSLAKIFTKPPVPKKSSSTQKDQYPKSTLVPKKSIGGSTQNVHPTKDTIKNNKDIYKTIDLSIVPKQFKSETIKAFIDHRIKKKSPLTQYALKLFIGKCISLDGICGLSANEIVNETIEADWKGVQKHWLENRLKDQSNNFNNQTSQDRVNAELEKWESAQ